MQDTYKIALQLLQKIMQVEGYTNWVEWLQKDINDWENHQSTEHHIDAYGGTGSFNDVIVGGNDLKGIWQSKAFEMLQTMAYAFAKNREITKFSENYQDNQISGWRCQNCGAARINERDIEICLSKSLFPRIMDELIEKNRLEELLDVEKIMFSKNVSEKRESVKKLIINSKITIPTDINWLWNCPTCGSNEVCVYRWVIDGDNLTEASDNLEIRYRK